MNNASILPQVLIKFQTLFGTELIIGNLNNYGVWNFSNEYRYIENILQASVKYCFGHKWANHRMISNAIKFCTVVIFDL